MNWFNKIFKNDDSSELEEKILDDLSIEMESLKDDITFENINSLELEPELDNEEGYILDEEDTLEPDLSDNSESDENLNPYDKDITAEDIMDQYLQHVNDMTNDLDSRIQELKDQEADLKRKLNMK